MKKTLSYILLGLYIFLLLIPVSNQAAEKTNTSFSVKAVLPENQISKEKTYFDLRVTPGSEQVIEVEVKNHSDQLITVVTDANTAYTNNNGITEYNKATSKIDNTLEHPFSELATVDEKELVLKAGEKKNVKIRLKIPKKAFNGYILGGLYFYVKDETDKEEKKQITNMYSYTIGVLLSESDEKLAPFLTLNEVKPDQKNFRNVILANIQNKEAALVKNMSVEGKVYSETGKDVLYETKKENLRMAPNSNFDFAIHLNNQPFEAGKYRIEVNAVADGEKYSWEKVMMITTKAAKNYNEKALDLEKDEDENYYTIFSVVISFLLIIIIVLIARDYKRKRKVSKKKKA